MLMCFILTGGTTLSIAAWAHPGASGPSPLSPAPSHHWSMIGAYQPSSGSSRAMHHWNNSHNSQNASRSFGSNNQSTNSAGTGYNSASSLHSQSNSQVNRQTLIPTALYTQYTQSVGNGLNLLHHQSAGSASFGYPGHRTYSPSNTSNNIRAFSGDARLTGRRNYISLSSASLISAVRQASPKHLWNSAPFSFKSISTGNKGLGNFLSFHASDGHDSRIGYLSAGGQNTGAQNTGGYKWAENLCFGFSGTRSAQLMCLTATEHPPLQFQGTLSNQPVTLGTTANGSLLGDANLSAAFGLNLASPEKLLTAPASLTGVTIITGGQLGANDTVSGGHIMIITAGESLTAAQLVAAQQVVTSGQQTLVLTNRGTAIAGLVTLKEGQTSLLSDLVVPKGVTLVAVGYTSSNALDVSGSAKVLGNVDLVQSAGNIGSVLDVGSLAVGRSGDISNSLSANMLSSLSGSNAGGYNPPLLFSSNALNLNVIGNVLNQGSITSSGALSINAGGSISNISSSQRSGFASNGSITAGGASPAPTIGAIAILGSTGAPIQIQGTGNVSVAQVQSGSISLIPTASGKVIQSGNSNAMAKASSGTATIAGTSVNLSSGTGKFTNSGSINATGGNIAFNAPNSINITIANNKGKIQAFNGAINVRDANYAGTANITLTSGNYLSQQLNLNAGTGVVDVNAGEITGTVNTTAGAEHLSAATANLILGNSFISGDPTYYNTAGAITIAGTLNFSGQDLAIVANTNIATAAGAGSINTSSSSANGGNITMIAGVSFTSTGGASGNNNTTSTLSNFAATAAGGKIDLNSGTAITSLNSASSHSGSSGGNITLIAFGGTGSGAGTITLPSAVTVTSGGAGGGSNGNITIIAGASSGTSISIGPINTTGGSGTGGNVYLLTAAPTITGSPIITNGTLSGGTFTGGAIKGANIYAGAITAAGDVTINTNGSFNQEGIISATNVTITNGR